MQTEVMRYYGLDRPPVDLGFFETEAARRCQVGQRFYSDSKCEPFAFGK